LHGSDFSEGEQGLLLRTPRRPKPPPKKHSEYDYNHNVGAENGFSEERKVEDYEAQREKKFKDNAEKLEKVLEIIGSLENLEHTLGTQGEMIVGDTSAIVQEIMLDEAIPVLSPSQKLSVRAIKLFLTMFIISFWAGVLTFVLSLGFYWLNENNHTVVVWMDCFAEGLSGGAFLATIAGTMLPRVQQDAYRTSWTKEVSKILGLIAFEVGLSAVVILDVVLE